MKPACEGCGKPATVQVAAGQRAFAAAEAVVAAMPLPCAWCGAPATTTADRVRNPEYAARVVASVHGVLRASDFYRAPACEECAL